MAPYRVDSFSSGKSAVENKYWQDAKFTFNKNSCTVLAGEISDFLRRLKSCATKLLFLSRAAA